ncbi:DNA repair protein RecO [Halioxenophilus aromaticivorans]|uniref:DNA repair protein RecO n=1 Tax=Halioxenophilus aromaticivorans TaxID=1306992 RepID=A0AAV3TW37_9ALTE
MNPKDNFQPAYVIHSRPYRETSLLVDFLTANYGRVSVVVRGARRSQKKRSIYQPFAPMQVTWSGNSQLKTLRNSELAGMSTQLKGKRLYSGLYLNELLYRLLQPEEPAPALFAGYMRALGDLAQAADDLSELASLRRFELRLLDELGYGVDYTRDGQTGAVIAANARYGFLLNVGFVADPYQGDIPGHLLAAIAQGNWQTDQLAILKRVNRSILDSLLGPKPLHSRSLYLATMPPSST